MQKEYLIAIDEFCSIHGVAISFVTSLQQAGLIEIRTVRESAYIHTDQLQQLEKIIRLYKELDINVEGIETIIHLLQKLDYQQQEIIELRNRLRLYEIDE